MLRAARRRVVHRIFPSCVTLLSSVHVCHHYYHHRQKLTITIININQHQHHNSRRENGSLFHFVSRPTFCVSSKREILQAAFDRLGNVCTRILVERHRRRFDDVAVAIKVSPYALVVPTIRPDARIITWAVCLTCY